MTAKKSKRHTWPLVVLAVLLALMDAFAVLVFIEGAIDTTDTEGKVGGLIFFGLVIVLLSWLLFVTIRAAAGRSRPAAKRRPVTGDRPAGAVSTGRRLGGTVLAIVFFGIAALIVGIEIADMAHGDFSGASGLTGAAVCAGVGSMGLAMRRTPSATQRAELIGALRRAEQERDLSGTGQGAGDAGPARHTPSWVGVPVDRTVRARELLSETSWLLVVCAIALPALLIWAITVSPSWLVGVIALVMVVPVILIVIVGFFLPYGIRLGDGVLTVGALGVPRIGRVWKRQEIPLEEVLAWAVWPRGRAPQELPRSPFPDGELPVPHTTRKVAGWGNLIAPRAQHVLIVRVDPSRVPAAMPAVVLSGFAVQSTTASSVDTGTYLIGTRHPQRWALTLDKTMPSRRSLT